MLHTFWWDTTQAEKSIKMVGKNSQKSAYENNWEFKKILEEAVPIICIVH